MWFSFGFFFNTFNYQKKNEMVYPGSINLRVMSSLDITCTCASECQSALTGSKQFSAMRHIVLCPTPCYCLHPVTCIESVTWMRNGRFIPSSFTPKTKRWQQAGGRSPESSRLLVRKHTSSTCWLSCVSSSRETSQYHSTKCVFSVWQVQA